VPVWGCSLGDTARPPTNQDAWSGRGRAAVCLDGLGGHGDGEVASAIGARAFDVAVDGALERERPASVLFDAMRSSLLMARDEARDGGPGNSAMTAAAVVAVLSADAPHVHLAWAGDCRAYVWSPRARGVLTRATEDHDEIYNQWLQSRCSDAAAARARAAVDRAQTASEAFHLGGALAKKAFRRRNSMHVELAIGEASARDVPLADGGFVMLTSDGVHGNLTHPELEDFVFSHLESSTDALAGLPATVCAAAQRLGDEGSGRRHPDDITAVVLSR
jgi:serine/threonine protein phosphatase PrpC